jgi:hypothetical protein
MKSIVGSVLALIDGILSFIIALILLIVSLIFFIDPGILSIIDMGISQYLVGIFILVPVLIFALIGFAKLYCAKLMNNPNTTRTGGIISLIIGIITLGILSIIAGIFGIMQGDKKKR